MRSTALGLGASRPLLPGCSQSGRRGPGPGRSRSQGAFLRVPNHSRPVSYTHLTLPTICSV
eukprot:6133141-Alexandrium_andersonii.AAC.1